MALALGPYIPVHGFRRNCHDGFRFASSADCTPTVSLHADWNAIPAATRDSLLQATGNNATLFTQPLQKRWRLWVATVGSRMAAYGWLRGSNESGDFFFPLEDAVVLVWYTETLPEFRGKGMMAAALDNVVWQLRREGSNAVLATCATYNVASRRGLEKANFRIIGKGLMRAGSGRGVLWRALAKHGAESDSQRQ